MQPLTTTEQAVTFWAAKAAEFDELRKSLDLLLPKTCKNRDTQEPEAPVSEDTYDAIEEALDEALLAADQALGAYARVLHQERAAPGGQMSAYSHQSHQY